MESNNVFWIKVKNAGTLSKVVSNGLVPLMKDLSVYDYGKVNSFHYNEYFDDNKSFWINVNESESGFAVVKILCEEFSTPILCYHNGKFYAYDSLGNPINFPCEYENDYGMVATYIEETTGYDFDSDVYFDFLDGDEQDEEELEEYEEDFDDAEFENEPVSFSSHNPEDRLNVLDSQVKEDVKEELVNQEVANPSKVVNFKEPVVELPKDASVSKEPETVVEFISELNKLEEQDDLTKNTVVNANNGSVNVENLEGNVIINAFNAEVNIGSVEGSVNVNENPLNEQDLQEELAASDEENESSDDIEVEVEIEDQPQSDDSGLSWVLVDDEVSEELPESDQPVAEVNQPEELKLDIQESENESNDKLLDDSLELENEWEELVQEIIEPNEEEETLEVLVDSLSNNDFQDEFKSADDSLDVTNDNIKPIQLSEEIAQEEIDDISDLLKSFEENESQEEIVDELPEEDLNSQEEEQEDSQAEFDQLDKDLQDLSDLLNSEGLEVELLDDNDLTEEEIQEEVELNDQDIEEDFNVSTEDLDAIINDFENDNSVVLQQEPEVEHFDCEACNSENEGLDETEIQNELIQESKDKDFPYENIAVLSEAQNVEDALKNSEISGFDFVSNEIDSPEELKEEDLEYGDLPLYDETSDNLENSLGGIDMKDIFKEDVNNCLVDDSENEICCELESKEPVADEECECEECQKALHGEEVEAAANADDECECEECQKALHGEDVEALAETDSDECECEECQKALHGEEVEAVECESCNCKEDEEPLIEFDEDDGCECDECVVARNGETVDNKYEDYQECCCEDHDDALEAANVEDETCELCAQQDEQAILDEVSAMLEIGSEGSEDELNAFSCDCAEVEAPEVCEECENEKALEAAQPKEEQTFVEFADIAAPEVVVDDVVKVETPIEEEKLDAFNPADLPPVEVQPDFVWPESDFVPPVEEVVPALEEAVEVVTPVVELPLEEQVPALVEIEKAFAPVEEPQDFFNPADLPPVEAQPDFVWPESDFVPPVEEVVPALDEDVEVVVPVEQPVVEEVAKAEPVVHSEEIVLPLSEAVEVVAPVDENKEPVVEPVVEEVAKVEPVAHSEEVVLPLSEAVEVVAPVDQNEEPVVESTDWDELAESVQEADVELFNHDYFNPIAVTANEEPEVEKDDAEEVLPIEEPIEDVLADLDLGNILTEEEIAPVEFGVEAEVEADKPEELVVDEVVVEEEPKEQQFNDYYVPFHLEDKDIEDVSQKHEEDLSALEDELNQSLFEVQELSFDDSADKEPLENIELKLEDVQLEQPSEAKVEDVVIDSVVEEPKAEEVLPTVVEEFELSLDTNPIEDLLEEEAPVAAEEVIVEKAVEDDSNKADDVTFKDLLEHAKERVETEKELADELKRFLEELNVERRKLAEKKALISRRNEEAKKLFASNYDPTLADKVLRNWKS